MEKNRETKRHPNYKQPHNISIRTGNPALDARLIEKEHRRQRYWSRWGYGKDKSD